MNRFDEMRAAVNEAESTLRAVDSIAEQLARMLVGRLRKVSSYYLSKLKRELRDYNIHTGKWKA